MDSIVTPPTSRTRPILGFATSPACVFRSTRLDSSKPEVAFQNAEVGFARTSGWISRVLRLDFVGTSILFAELTNGAEPVLSRPRPYGMRCRSPTERGAAPLRNVMPYLRNEVPYPTERRSVPYGTRCRVTRKRNLRITSESNTEERGGASSPRRCRLSEWQEKP